MTLQSASQPGYCNKSEVIFIFRKKTTTIESIDLYKSIDSTFGLFVVCMQQLYSSLSVSMAQSVWRLWSCAVFALLCLSRTLQKQKKLPFLQTKEQLLEA